MEYALCKLLNYYYYYYMCINASFRCASCGERAQEYWTPLISSPSRSPCTGIFARNMAEVECILSRATLMLTAQWKFEFAELCTTKRIFNVRNIACKSFRIWMLLSAKVMFVVVVVVAARRWRQTSISWNMRSNEEHWNTGRAADRDI